jgi:putative hydrolase of HD superfamily
MEDLLDFVEYLSKLKLTVRTGWKMLEVEKGETIGSHSFSTAFLAWILAKKKKLDVNKTIKMALIHDLIEGITGDVSAVEEKYIIKHSLEEKAMPELKKILPKELENDVENLILELNEGKTEESKVVKEADKLDTAFQAFLYNKTGEINQFDLSGFIEFAEEVCQEGHSKELIDYIKSLQKNKKSK